MPAARHSSVRLKRTPVGSRARTPAACSTLRRAFTLSFAAKPSAMRDGSSRSVCPSRSIISVFTGLHHRKLRARKACPGAAVIEPDHTSDVIIGPSSALRDHADRPGLAVTEQLGGCNAGTAGTRPPSGRLFVCHYSAVAATPVRFSRSREKARSSLQATC